MFVNKELSHESLPFKIKDAIGLLARKVPMFVFQPLLSIRIRFKVKFKDELS